MIMKIIQMFIDFKLKGSLTLHFDGAGSYKIETSFGDEATRKLTDVICS